MRSHRVYFIATAILFAGIVTVATGFGWALVSGVAVPYPDPTDEQRAYELSHRAVSTVIMDVGTIVSLGALISIPTLFLWRRYWQKHAVVPVS